MNGMFYFTLAVLAPIDYAGESGSDGGMHRRREESGVHSKTKSKIQARLQAWTT